MLNAFLDYLTYERCLSKHTILSYKTDLLQLSEYLTSEFQILPEEATYKMLRTWLMSLAKKGLEHKSINRKIASVKSFHTFLCKQKLISTSEAKRVKSLKVNKSIPSFVQESALLDLLDNHPFPDNFEGWRARLVLELFYSTGIRLQELIDLEDRDINFYDRTIRVIGKRNKERVIPVPKHTLSVVEKYLTYRQQITTTPCRLFIIPPNNPCYPVLIQRIVKYYLSNYTQGTKCSPHMLRHTFATHLLNHGAELQAIKDLLGHTSLAATQVYTHNSIEKIKQIFTQAHPRA